MQNEQLQLMKVIQFPKNKLKENKERLNKLEVAYKLLKCLVEDGADFHIVVTKESAETLYNFPTGEYKYATITSDLEEAQKIRLNDNTFFYPVKGDEF